MTDEGDFLAAIRESPDDDDLRLVFADWLEERGDGRSEYLRALVSAAERVDRGEDAGPALGGLQELAQGIDEDWRRAVGISYRVVVDSVVPHPLLGRIPLVINLMRSRSLDLKEAKDLGFTPPPFTGIPAVLLENSDSSRKILEELAVRGEVRVDSEGRPERICRTSLRRA